MKITLCSNYLTHHQYYLCCELYKRCNTDFRFISTVPFAEERRKSGWKEYDNVPFEIQSYNSQDAMQEAIKWCNESDVVIIGSAPISFVHQRILNNKLTFRYNERPLKQGITIKNFLKVLYTMMKYHMRYQRHPLYMLCASAYTAYDFSRFGCYLNRCFKWGYFTNVIDYNIDKLISLKEAPQKITILWVARLIEWKHPEICVEVAKRLRERCIDFNLIMIGDGILENKIRLSIEQNRLEKYIKMLGAISSDEVRQYMERSNIFLFTSDYNEGWGAVLAESMNSGCAVLANRAIGSAPFLIDDMNNGILYENGNIEMLIEKLVHLINDRSLRTKLGRNAYQTMKSVWNASVAAERLITLSNNLISGKSCEYYSDGPCSIAEILKH